MSKSESFQFQLGFHEGLITELRARETDADTKLYLRAQERVCDELQAAAMRHAEEAVRKETGMRATKMHISAAKRYEELHAAVVKSCVEFMRKQNPRLVAKVAAAATVKQAIEKAQTNAPANARDAKSD